MQTIVYRPHMHGLLVFLCILGLGLGQPARSADACSCMFATSPGTWWPSSGTLPANATGLVYHNHFLHLVRSVLKKKPLSHFMQVEIEVSKGTYKAVPFRVVKWKSRSEAFLVQPKGGLKVGKIYRFIVNWSRLKTLAPSSELRALKPYVAKVTVSSTKLKSMTLPLAVKGPLQGSLTVARGASCSWKVFASYVEISMTLPASYRMFRNVLFFQTYAGRSKWYASHNICSLRVPGESWMGRGHDTVYAHCYKGMSGIVKLGSHPLRMEAVLPGTKVKLTVVPKKIHFACKTRKKKRWGFW